MRELKQALRSLDAVEGFDSDAPQRALFKREMAEVTLANNRRVIAWVYLLNHVPNPWRRITSGDYAAVRND